MVPGIVGYGIGVSCYEPSEHESFADLTNRSQIVDIIIRSYVIFIDLRIGAGYSSWSCHILGFVEEKTIFN